MQLLKSSNVKTTSELSEDYFPGSATISGDFTFCDSLSSSEFVMSEGNRSAKFESIAKVHLSNENPEFRRLPSVATWFCSVQGMKERRESACSFLVVGSTVFESGCYYFEISAEFTSNRKPPAVGIMEANSNIMDNDSFSGVAITASAVDGLRQLSGSFALQEKAIPVRSAEVRSGCQREIRNPGSNSPVMVCSSLLLTSLAYDDLLNPGAMTRTRLLEFFWI
jgi:hypothetical protein